MRFVLFGEATSAVAALASPPVREAVTRLAAGQRIEPPVEAVEAGLIVDGDRGCELGSILMLPPDDVGGHLDRAAEHASDIIAGSVNDLIAALAVDHPDVAWRSASLLVVGGALLDLAVGEELCLSGAVGGLGTAGKLWMLPEAKIAVGMRCVHDASRQVGAAVMWTADDPAPDLPNPADVADLVTPVAAPSALTLLKLRHSGWLSGLGHRFVTLRPDSELGRTLSRVAKRVATEAYADAFAALAPRDLGHPRLMVSRLVFERVLARLIHRDVIEPTATLRRLAWTGPAWRLMTLEAGIE